MKVLQFVDQLGQLEKGCVVTIGNFDGLHIGHQEILATAKRLAAKHKTELLAMTFDPHPAAVLHPEKSPDVLTPAPLKKHLLADCGVDSWLIIKTDKKVLALSAPDFIHKFVVEPITPVAMVEGEDFYFGSGRSGNIDLLRRLGPANDFDVNVVPAKQIELDQTIRVSSTMVRYMLTSGEVTDAATALGRAYKMIGKVVPGHGLGRKLGYPTLNMEKPGQLIPAEGVYAGFVNIADSYDNACCKNQNLPAAFSIGQARTFGDEHPLLIEAHLLIGSGKIPSGQYMAMDFIQHIRPQHKFSSPQDLIAQIAKDCKTAKDILG